MDAQGLRLGTSAAAKQKRLLALQRKHSVSDTALSETVADAQILGSLELAGVECSWDQVRASRRGEAAPDEINRLRRALDVVAGDQPLSVDALLAWHGAVIGAEGQIRSAERSRPLPPPPAAPVFIIERLATLADWLGAESARDLKPAPAAALALARIVEIAPFDDGNGRVARLAAAHLMRRGGARPPILVAGDRTRLEASLQAAFRFETEPLAALLAEAAERSLEVMIQAAEQGAVRA
jgi:Fic family protein